MYTEAIVERTGFQLAKPQELTTTATVNSAAIDFSQFNRGCLRFLTGTFGGTSPTLSAALQVQFSADNSTWYSATATNNNATITAANEQQSFEVRGDILAQQSAQDGRAYRYARLQAVCTVGGTSPTIPILLDAFGQDAKQGPGSQFNDASVQTPLQLTAT